MSGDPELQGDQLHLPEALWQIESDDDFAWHLSNYIFEKSIHRRLLLSQVEQNIFDLTFMQAHIEGDGFCDLFYQQYSLTDCERIERFMRDIEMVQLADWFAEAKAIYCRRKTDITNEEYERLDPFSLSEEEGGRFDKIGDLFLSADSQLFDMAWRIRAYANKFRDQIV